MNKKKIIHTDSKGGSLFPTFLIEYENYFQVVVVELEHPAAATGWAACRYLAPTPRYSTRGRGSSTLPSSTLYEQALNIR